MNKNVVTVLELRNLFEKYQFLKDVSQKDLNFLLNVNIENKAVRKSKYEHLYEGRTFGSLLVLKYIPRIKHNWGVLYLCRCLICNDLFLVHCEKIESNYYKCCYKDSCNKKCNIEKIQISGFSLPKNYTNTDISKIVDFINKKYKGIVYKNFEFIKCCGIDINKNNNLYVKIEIKCLKCNAIREYSYGQWKKGNDNINCDNCNKLSGKLIIRKKDNLSSVSKDECFNLSYKNKKSDKYVYLGKWRISDGNQKIWVQCRDCSYIMLVNGDDYLNDVIFDCYCNNVKAEYKEQICDIFSDFNGYIHFDDSFIGKVIGTDKIISKVDSKPILQVKCLKCGSIRNVLEEEFLNERTKYFNECSCSKEKDNNIKVNDRFGHLTVQKVTDNYIYLVCDCGKEVNYTIETFKKSRNRVCSSHCNYPKFCSKYFDRQFIGKQINNFVIRGFLKRETFSNKNNYGSYWLCECLKCGSLECYPATEILRGNKKSCCFGTKYFDINYIGKQINGVEILDIFKVKGSGLGTLWQCKCPYCGDYFISQPTFILDESVCHCGCQSKSKGELVVEKYLNDLNINKDFDIFYQYSFSDLLSEKNARLRYDFGVVLKSNNQLCLIEYDGPQHYDINSVIGAKSEEEARRILELTKKHDSMKNNYALKNNYPLLRIRDTKSRKSIENKVYNFLKGIGGI